MRAGHTVSDASPLIGLHQIGRLSLLERRFGRTLIPPAVRRETRISVPSVHWIEERSLMLPLPAVIRHSGLDQGESEAIGLAIEVEARTIILDERAARRFAERLGLTVIGTAGILIAAKRSGEMPAVRPELDALLEHGFFLARELYDTALVLAGE